MTVKEGVIIDALRLSEAERLEVAERLYESIEGPADGDAEAAWAGELERRVRAADSGQGRFITWEEARRQIAGEDGGDSR